MRANQMVVLLVGAISLVVCGPVSVGSGFEPAQQDIILEPVGAAGAGDLSVYIKGSSPKVDTPGKYGMLRLDVATLDYKIVCGKRTDPNDPTKQIPDDTWTTIKIVKKMGGKDQTVLIQRESGQAHLTFAIGGNVIGVYCDNHLVPSPCLNTGFPGEFFGAYDSLAVFKPKLSPQPGDKYDYCTAISTGDQILLKKP